MAKLVLGLAPTRRDTKDFPLEYAWERKALVEKKVREICDRLNVEVVNIDFINDEGLMIFPEDAKRVADYFIEKKVDCIIAPHVNFGSEEVVSALGRIMRKPLLLWGPRDDTPPAVGPRQTDTQCGLFATGNVLRRYNVKFSYLENCWIDSKTFEDGLEHFLRVANVVKSFQDMRVGQVSVRPRTFLTCKINEGQLLENFGIEIVTIDYTEMYLMIKDCLEENSQELNDIIKRLNDKFEIRRTEEQVRNIAAMELAYLKLAEKYHLDCFASECWRTYSMPFGIMPCPGYSDLSACGLYCACECDILGAITLKMLDAATLGSNNSGLADLTIRHPENDNAELLWHCGAFSRNMAKKGTTPVLNETALFECEHTDITVCRLAETNGQYLLFTGEGKGIDGPKTNGTYVWFETNDWPKWEAKLVKGPYIHHMALTPGKYASVLEDACEYIGLTVDKP